MHVCYPIYQLDAPPRSWSLPWSAPSSIASPPAPAPALRRPRCAARGPGASRPGRKSTAARGAALAQRKSSDFPENPRTEWFVARKII